METDVLVFGISAVILVAGMVQFAKKLGITDKGSLILAMVLGPVIMAGNEAVKQFPFVSPWIQALVMGLMVSLTASGLWDGAKALISRPAQIAAQAAVTVAAIEASSATPISESGR